MKLKLSRHANVQPNLNTLDVQKSLDCSVIISGLANDAGDLNGNVTKILTAAVENFDAATISKSERLFRQDDASPKTIDKIPIIVTMTTSDAAIKVVKDFRKKGALTAEECTVPGGQSRLYIKHQLTPLNLTIMKEARKLKVDGKLKFVWFQNSSVLVRVEETAKIQKILTIDDLLKFK